MPDSLPAASATTRALEDAAPWGRFSSVCQVMF